MANQSSTRNLGAMTQTVICTVRPQRTVVICEHIKENCWNTRLHKLKYFLVSFGRVSFSPEIS